MKDQRTRAYAAGAKIARERHQREAPMDAEALRRVTASDIVVVEGCYDHVQAVLEALEMPHTRLADAQLDRVHLRPEQLLVINCPGAIVRVRDFVAAGGSLFTTDWALRNVIEPAFANTIAYNERRTADDVVRI